MVLTAAAVFLKTRQSLSNPAINCTFFSQFVAGMRSFGHLISQTINTILLFLVYAVGIGATSAIARLFGKHFMDMKLSSQAESYWTELDLEHGSIDPLYRQF